MELEVLRAFNERVSKTFAANPHVKNYLLDHPNKAKVIQSACHELRCFDLTYKWKSHDKATGDRAAILNQVIDLFCRIALDQAEHHAKSSVERIRIQTERDRMKELEAEFAEMQKEATTDSVRVFQSGVTA